MKGAGRETAGSADIEPAGISQYQPVVMRNNERPATLEHARRQTGLALVPWSDVQLAGAVEIRVFCWDFSIKKH